MRVLLTSAGLETDRIQEYFIKLTAKDMSQAKALFIPTAAIDAGAIAVLPKCMNDLLKCGIREENITVFDLHRNMDIQELKQYDIVYLCGGDTCYLLERINATGFHTALNGFIASDGVVLGVSAGSLIFANNMPGSLKLVDTKLNVHCAEGELPGPLSLPLKENVLLTDRCALAVTSLDGGLEIIGG